MKKLQLITFLLLIFTINQSFIQTQPNYIGTFGVTSDDPSQLKLSIEKDGNFSYQDFSNPTKRIEVNGTWKVHGKSVILTSSSAIKFHSKWKFNDNGTVAKSRKGLSFYTLGRIDP